MFRLFVNMLCLKKQNNFQLRYEKKTIIRRVAQLVEHRSPKPGVAGSIPASPAMEK